MDLMHGALGSWTVAAIGEGLNAWVVCCTFALNASDTSYYNGLVPAVVSAAAGCGARPVYGENVEKLTGSGYWLHCCGYYL